MAIDQRQLTPGTDAPAARPAPAVPTPPRPRPGRGDAELLHRLARPLLYAGVVGVVLGASKVHAAWVAQPAYDYTGSSRFAWSIAYMAILAATAYGVGLPDLARGRRAALVSALAAAGAAAVGVSLVQLAVGDALLPRFVVFGAAALLVPWYVVTAVLAAGGRSRAEERDRVVVVAGPADADALRAELLADPERPAQLVGVLDTTTAVPQDGTGRPLVERVVQERATVVVLSRDAQADESIVAQAAALHENGVRIRTLSLFYEQWLGKLPLGELERVGLMFDIGEVHRARYGRVKRLADVVLATAGLVVLGALLPVVLLANLVGNRGPVLYRQPRVGRNGRIFHIVKLRTMVPDASGDTRWTASDDDRITRFGRILRRTHLDELPQVVNILRGELSLVGPRPEQPRYVAELTARIPFYDLRHLVRPGLTGWAQVKYRYASDEHDAMEKLQYEFFYLRHQGVVLDVRILGRTIRSVLGRGGR